MAAAAVDGEQDERNDEEAEAHCDGGDGAVVRAAPAAPVEGGCLAGNGEYHYFRDGAEWLSIVSAEGRMSTRREDYKERKRALRRGQGRGYILVVRRRITIIG